MEREIVILPGAIKDDKVTVPLTYQGQVIGTAEVDSDGKIVATLDSKDIGKNFHYLFSSGIADKFSIGHNYAPDWDLPPCSSNID